jgi:cytochrome c-type biogenesis protein CcmH
MSIWLLHQSRGHGKAEPDEHRACVGELMIFWVILALMTLTASIVVFWPFIRRSKTIRSGSDLAVYQDQLEELKSDRAAGLIGVNEAEAARIEISRRLLMASDAAEIVLPATSAYWTTWRSRAAAFVAFLFLPLGSAALYLSLGSPLSSHISSPAETQSVESTIERVEAYLQSNPQDGQGWEVLAPVYMQQGRFNDAVNARRKALDILGADAARLGDLGEALVLLANGIVTAEAQTLFQRAAAFDPEDVMASYYLGLAAKQDGRRGAAEKAWRALVARAPQDAPWLALVQDALARLDEKDIPAGNVAADQHGGASVEGMVERLAKRLKQDGSSVEGWVQLVRSYRVLGQPDKAAAALADAKIALAGDTDKLSLLADGMQALESGSAAITSGRRGTDRIGGPNQPGPGPSDPDIAAAAKLAPEQQTEMIRGMVARLAGRLEKDGSDSEGWLRLVRAYVVLGDQAKAQTAIADARRALANDVEKLRQFEDRIKVLGVDG